MSSSDGSNNVHSNGNANHNVSSSSRTYKEPKAVEQQEMEDPSGSARQDCCCWPWFLKNRPVLR